MRCCIIGRRLLCPWRSEIGPFPHPSARQRGSLWDYWHPPPCVGGREHSRAPQGVPQRSGSPRCYGNRFSQSKPRSDSFWIQEKEDKVAASQGGVGICLLPLWQPEDVHPGEVTSGPLRESGGPGGSQNGAVPFLPTRGCEWVPYGHGNEYVPLLAERGLATWRNSIQRHPSFPPTLSFKSNPPPRSIQTILWQNELPHQGCTRMFFSPPSGFHTRVLSRTLPLTLRSHRAIFLSLISFYLWASLDVHHCACQMMVSLQ